MTPLLEKEIRAKRVLFRKSKRSSLQVDREAFNRQRNKRTKLMRKAGELMPSCYIVENNLTLSLTSTALFARYRASRIKCRILN